MAKRFIFNIREKIGSLFPQRNDTGEARQVKLMLWGIVGVFIAALFVGTVVFLLTLQGLEIVMMPKLEGLKIIDALNELQDRNLVPYIQTRFFEEQEGVVINQIPDAGSQTRVGRTVYLTVSKGPVLSQVGDYVGMTLDELRRNFAAQFAIHEALLEVREENISYIFSEEPVQTILSQDPPPGSKLAAYTDLKLLVSQGTESLGTMAPEARGLDYRQAIGMLAVKNIPFVFRFSSEEFDSEPGTVISQSPEAGDLIANYLELVINPLQVIGSNQVAGIYSQSLPKTNVPARVSVEFINSIGERKPYFQTTRRGGAFSFPYLYETGSRVQVYVNDELLSETVEQSLEEEVVGEEPANNETNF